MLVQAISDHSVDLRIVEKSLKVTRYVGGLLMLLSQHPIGGRLKALGALRQPIWAAYAIRDLNGREGKSPALLLFRTCFLIGYISRNLQKLVNWSILDVTRKTSKLNPFLILFFCTKSANETLQKKTWDTNDKLSLVDDFGEGIATAIDDAELIAPFPGIEWVEVVAGLSAGTACLTKAILEKRETRSETGSEPVEPTG